MALAELRVTVPEREEQIDTLWSLLGESPCQLPPCLYLWGDSGSGKSTVLEKVLAARGVTCAAVKCVELYSHSLLFQEALNTFVGWTPSSSNGYAPYASCDSLGEFVRHLQLLDNTKRMALVVYECERIRTGDPHLLPGLARLQELTGANLMVVLVSDLPVDRILPTTAALAPTILHFPQYNNDELLRLLLCERCAAADDTYDDQFHVAYLNLLMSVFYPATRSISEMRHLATVHWSSYTAPVVKGEVRPDDLRKLWRNIEPHLRRSLETVFLREVTSTQYDEMQRLAEESSNSLPTVDTLSARAAKIELPFYSKFLLISSYLASYNPAKTDRRFFVKHHGKQKKTLHTIKAKERSCSQLTGPKLFPLDRLLAIFYSISDCKHAPTAALLTQLSTLVSLRLVAQCGGDDQLDAPKYKCAVSLSVIRTIARTVDFDIVHHLYDFS